MNTFSVDVCRDHEEAAKAGGCPYCALEQARSKASELQRVVDAFCELADARHTLADGRHADARHTLRLLAETITDPSLAASCRRLGGEEFAISIGGKP